MSPHSNHSEAKDSPLLIDLLETVAEARDEDITSLPPIRNSLDCEALDKFISSAEVDTVVMIEIYNCTISIDSEKNITATYNNRT